MYSHQQPVDGRARAAGQVLGDDDHKYVYLYVCVYIYMSICIVTSSRSTGVLAPWARSSVTMTEASNIYRCIYMYVYIYMYVCVCVRLYV